MVPGLDVAPWGICCSCKQGAGLGTSRDSFWLYIHTELERSLGRSWGEAAVVDTTDGKGKGCEGKGHRGAS